MQKKRFSDTIPTTHAGTLSGIADGAAKPGTKYGYMFKLSDKLVRRYPDEDFDELPDVLDMYARAAWRTALYRVWGHDLRYPVEFRISKELDMESVGDGEPLDSFSMGPPGTYKEARALEKEVRDFYKRQEEKLRTLNPDTWIKCQMFVGENPVAA